MIEKFNFYDIYGYFLPGAAVLLLFWLPVGIKQHKLPTGDWTSALLGAVIAYVTGILLQTFADKVLRSTAAKGQEGDQTYDRFPSQKLLDAGGPLSATLKTGVAEAVESKFGIKKDDLAVEHTPTKAQDAHRNDAFLLARHFLVAAKEASYVEQYEGMYALTRGLAAALGLAGIYYIGWAISFLGGGWTSTVCYLAVCLGVVLALFTTVALILRKTHGSGLEWMAASGLLLAALGLGFGMGHHYGDTARLPALLLLCALAAFLASLRAYRFYKEFTVTFAVTVWRDFFVAGRKKPDAPAGSQPGGSGV
ncbi:MAG: hypothetical protein LAO76_07675 [Acidobacteriia bacterium]|nr:hypothetical protein [Terriglobia bacterium]